MQFRHEWKHQITFLDMLTLRARLTAVMKQDTHAKNGTYEIRSIYFDNLADKALREKIESVNRREKFRILYYNKDTSLLLLEKKCKINGLCHKEQTILSPEEVQNITGENYAPPKDKENRLLWELYTKRNTQGLRPKTIVDYIREPFCYGPGNVRVTLDHHIRTGLTCTDFLNPNCITIPTRDMPIILEVKWDEFLPTVIRDIVQTPGTHTAAFSKYAACRIYG